MAEKQVANQIEALISSAYSKLNSGKYGGATKQWCAWFVSDRAKAAGIPNEVIYRNTVVASIQHHYFTQGRYFEKGKRTPQRGDLVIMHWDRQGSNYYNHIGIVTGCDGSKVFTIEGNSGSPKQVREQKYPLNSANVCGYCVPKYDGVIEARNTDNAIGGSKEITVVQTREITPGTKKEYIAVEDFDGLNTDYKPTDRIQVLVGKRNTQEAVLIPVLEPVTWELTRVGAPGRLEFTYVKGLTGDDGKEINVNIQEGDPVIMKAGDVDLFFGYVFSKKRDRSGEIEIVAYDQLKYFTNTATYRYRDITASELLKMLCNDARLKYGEVEDTQYLLSGVADAQSLFDIMNDALDITTEYTDQLFVLYDDHGQITLKNMDRMKINYVLDVQTMSDYDYESTIEGTANVVEVAVDNRDTGVREVTMIKDRAAIEKWGYLQLYQTRTSNFEIDTVTRALYNFYGTKKRKLRIRDAFGDIRVRPGARIVVRLDLGDIVLSNMMMVNAVTHSFSESQHFMDMDLIGGAFNDE